MSSSVQRPTELASDYAVAGTLCLILLNYFSWVSGGPSTLLTAPILFASLVFVGLVLSRTRDWLLLGVLLYLVIVSLSNPNVGWDPRSLWFFHAKRMFMDGNLYARLDGYHSSPYPALFSAMAASLAKIQGFWSEQVPKLASIFFLLPALIAVRRQCNSSLLFWVWFLTLLLVAGIKLINGYQDPILGLYVVIFLVLAGRIEAGAVRWYSLTTVGLLAVMISFPLIKNEGLAMLLALLLAATVATPRFGGRLCALGVIALVVWWGTWQQHLSLAGISDSLMRGGASGIFERALARVTQVGPIFQILLDMAEKSAGWLIVYLGARRWLHGAPDQTNPPFSCFCHRTLMWWAFFYTSILFVIYISTPADLTWHLNTSVGRTMMPLNIALCSAIIFCLRPVIIRLFESKNPQYEN